MNANSRRILERKNNAQPDGAEAIVNSEMAAAQSTQKMSAYALRKAQLTKKVPTGTLELTIKRPNNEESESSFAPKLNKKSIQIA